VFGPLTGRLSVQATNPHVGQSLTSHFKLIVDDLTEIFETRWHRFRNGEAGTEVAAITDNLLELWCHRSLVVSPTSATLAIIKELKGEATSGAKLINFLRALDFEQTDANAIAAQLQRLSPARRRDKEFIKGLIFPRYTNAIRKLCAQTAHVVLARSLIYRVGEDQGVFSKRLIDEPLEQLLVSSRRKIGAALRPATLAMSAVQEQMRALLPTVYEQGEFDWWQVPAEKQAILKPTEKGLLAATDEGLERQLREVLLVLSGYDFSKVDLDVWRNVYQHYLPAEERQRLGGFYTPDELVGLVLDEVGYDQSEPGLCHLNCLDPASGSGAFITSALGRLLAHLDQPMACHGHITRRLPRWKSAEEKLKVVGSRIHAIDIHPFAAFLTTINSLFQLMPLYVAAHERNPDFPIQLDIFASDSLDKHEADFRSPELFERINARVRLTNAAAERYKQLLQQRFDRVFGNPPWGGVLKGPIAPVYDEVRKARFRQEFPNSANGKYDIYALFIERTSELLSSDGRAALITQDSFLNREWAAKLRHYLAGSLNLRTIISLNPFGNLFFHAMNTPAILVFDLRSRGPTNLVETVNSDSVPFERSMRPEQRRRYVVSTIDATLRGLRSEKRPIARAFATADLVPTQRLVETAARGWDISGQPPIVVNARTISATTLFEPSQGVTPGGVGCLNIFLAEPKHLDTLDRDLIAPVIKGLHIRRWRPGLVSRHLLYPYVSGGQLFVLIGVRWTRIFDVKCSV
jgi:N-6 DNA Methylase